MKSLQILQVAVACVAAGTPWLVVRVALMVAARHAAQVGAPFTTPRAVGHLTRATLLVLPVGMAAAFVLTPPSWLMGAIDAAAFALLSVFGLRALGEIDSASRPARDVAAAERTASLRPRRLAHYVPLPLRLVPFVVTAVGLLALGWRIDGVPSDRLLMRVSFILSAPVFLWLYEVWMRNEIAGQAGAGGDERVADERRRRRLRQIWMVEVILVAGLTGVGHALLGLDWIQQSAQVTVGTITGALLGVTGCALALSSDLTRRRYREAGSAANGR
jgi:hypothetical protein